MELLKNSIKIENNILTCESAERDQKFVVTNVGEFQGPVYIWKNLPKGAKSDEFMMIYDGNINIESDDIAVIVLKSKEQEKYLITKDACRLYMKFK